MRITKYKTTVFCRACGETMEETAEIDVSIGGYGFNTICLYRDCLKRLRGLIDAYLSETGGGTDKPEQGGEG